MEICEKLGKNQVYFTFCELSCQLHACKLCSYTKTKLLPEFDQLLLLFCCIFNIGIAQVYIDGIFNDDMAKVHIDGTFNNDIAKDYTDGTFNDGIAQVYINGIFNDDMAQVHIDVVFIDTIAQVYMDGIFTDGIAQVYIDCNQLVNLWYRQHKCT